MFKVVKTLNLRDIIIELGYLFFAAGNSSIIMSAQFSSQNVSREFLWDVFQR